jgi:hypothetical protein
MGHLDDIATSLHPFCVCLLEYKCKCLCNAQKNHTNVGDVGFNINVFGVDVGVSMC